MVSRCYTVFISTVTATSTAARLSLRARHFNFDIRHTGVVPVDPCDRLKRPVGRSMLHLRIALLLLRPVWQMETDFIFVGN